ncbi:MAG TPA: glutamate racemase [Smithellaceae bacterium]|nr:glutamate racemase [Smithellaceae bacterium]HOM70321.1 glutamate racemase [Smithellaceae bacterium]HOS08419.1 glutamate racemase [Smithellaceae bacterium]HOU03786.1 glutamate racemase [Smithellaceae bacterium]HPD49030.1 glutamate racemase [Smithellaceae bacterium]
MKNNQAIGVFDSGIGGLTVVRSLMERLPAENIIYFGDTARVPYGVKSVETINRYASQITEFLIKKKVKLLIVACNTMAAVAYRTIKGLSHVPVLEVINASARNAVTQAHAKSIGVIGTPATINSNAYARAIRLLDKKVKIFSQACPLFVPLVEEGLLNHRATKLIAEEYLKPLLAEKIDTLVLGCTHYPLLKPLLQDIVGRRVKLIDSAEAMADITAELIEKQNIGNNNKREPNYLFYVSDVPYRFQSIGEKFLGRKFSQVKVISL